MYEMGGPELVPGPPGQKISLVFNGHFGRQDQVRELVPNEVKPLSPHGIPCNLTVEILIALAFEGALDGIIRAGQQRAVDLGSCITKGLVVVLSTQEIVDGGAVEGVGDLLN